MANLFGTGINQVPTNGMLGNLAFQDKAFVSVDKIGIGTTATDTGTANQTLQNYGGAYISGNTGIGTTNPTSIFQVVGNVRFDSTTITLNAPTVTISDPDLILGLGGTITNPTDATASSGGIAIASTEGGIGLIDLNVVPAEVNPNTYKKFMWFRGGTGTNGLGAGVTDAWLSNYAIGIGSTAVPTGVYFAAGNVQITQNDISAVRNIQSSGITTTATLNVGVGGTIITTTSAGDVGISTTNPTAILHIGAATTSAANNAPLKINSGGTANLLATPEVGAIEYDGAFLYQTPNSTSGRAYFPPLYTFRLTANGSNIGNAIADFFATPSSLSLEASSIYKIYCYAYFTKNNAGTATWTHVFSNAPTLYTVRLMYSPTSGIGNGAQTNLLSYSGGQAQTSMAHAATGSLTTAVNHFAQFEATVITNAATNWRLRLTQSAGTATPLAGSFYTVEKIGSPTGTFVA